MKRSISGTLLVIFAASALLVACGATDTTPVTALPTAPIATTSARPSEPTAHATVSSLPTATPTGGRPGTARGTRYTLLLNEAISLPDSDLTIRFKGVTNDSRCPNHAAVACAWAGEATVTFEATTSADVTTLRGENPKTYGTYKGYVIQTVSLEPQPAYVPPPVPPGTATIPAPTASDPQEKTATILVTIAP